MTIICIVALCIVVSFVSAALGGYAVWHLLVENGVRYMEDNPNKTIGDYLKMTLDDM